MVPNTFHVWTSSRVSIKFLWRKLLKKITAFVCPFGLFEFERMRKGLKDSPLTFHRLMGKCVGDINLKELLVYLDDLIIHGRSLEEYHSEQKPRMCV